jgi:hypothetical protein
MIGDRHGLFGIASVVLDAEDNLSAVDAASSVYVSGGQFGSALDLIAGLRKGAGHGAGDRDPNILGVR